LAKKYKDFPKYSIWAILANTLTQNLTNILISSFYSISTLGLYSLVLRVLSIPSSLIGASIGQVFFQQATIEKQNTGNAIQTFNSTLKKLLIIGLPSFGTLFFIVEDLFAFVFGEEWRIAGTYAKILIPLYFIRFISSTVSGILIIFEKQKSELLLNIFLISTSMIIILLLNNFNQFLYSLSFFMSVNYLFFIFYYHNLAEGSK
jgi:O-antigen/teichoic acid export membrane protein